MSDTTAPTTAMQVDARASGAEADPAASPVAAVSPRAKVVLVRRAPTASVEASAAAAAAVASAATAVDSSVTAAASADPSVSAAAASASTAPPPQPDPSLSPSSVPIAASSPISLAIMAVSPSASPLSSPSHAALSAPSPSSSSLSPSSASAGGPKKYSLRRAAEPAVTPVLDTAVAATAAAAATSEPTSAAVDAPDARSSPPPPPQHQTPTVETAAAPMAHLTLALVPAATHPLSPSAPEATVGAAPPAITVNAAAPSTGWPAESPTASGAPKRYVVVKRGPANEQGSVAVAAAPSPLAATNPVSPRNAQQEQVAAALAQLQAQAAAAQTQPVSSPSGPAAAGAAVELVSFSSATVAAPAPAQQQSEPYPSASLASMPVSSFATPTRAVESQGPTTLSPAHSTSPPAPQPQPVLEAATPVTPTADRERRPSYFMAPAELQQHAPDNVHGSGQAAPAGSSANRRRSGRNSLTHALRPLPAHAAAVGAAPVLQQPHPIYPLAPVALRHSISGSAAGVSAAALVGQPLTGYAAAQVMRNSTPEIIAQLRPPSSPLHEGVLAHAASPAQQQQLQLQLQMQQLAFAQAQVQLHAQALAHTQAQMQSLETARSPSTGPGPGTGGLGGRRRAPQTPTLLQVASPPDRHSRGASLFTPSATPAGGGGSGSYGASPSAPSTSRPGHLPSLSVSQSPGASGNLAAQLQQFRLSSIAPGVGGGGGAAGGDGNSLIAAHDLAALSSARRWTRWTWSLSVGFSVAVLIFACVYALAHPDGGYYTLNPQDDIPTFVACALYAVGTLLLLFVCLRIMTRPNPYSSAIGFTFQVGLSFVALGVAGLLASMDRSEVLQIPGDTPLLLGVQAGFIGAGLSFICFAAWVHGAPSRSTDAALVLLGALDSSAISRDIRTMRAMNLELVAANQAKRNGTVAAPAPGTAPGVRPPSVASVGPWGGADSSRPVTGAGGADGFYYEDTSAPTTANTAGAGASAGGMRTPAGLIRMGSVGAGIGGGLGTSMRASRRTGGGTGGRKGKSMGAGLSFGGGGALLPLAFQNVGPGVSLDAGAGAGGGGGAASPDSAALKALLATNMALAAKVAQLESQQPTQAQQPAPTHAALLQSQRRSRNASKRVSDGGALSAEANHAVWNQTVGVT